MATKTYEEKQLEDYQKMCECLEQNFRIALKVYGLEAKHVLFTKTPPLANILIQIGGKCTPEDVKVIPTR